MKSYSVILAATVVAVSLLAVGTMGAEDAKIAEARYIEKVCNGVHPNYKQWDIDCEFQ